MADICALDEYPSYKDNQIFNKELYNPYSWRLMLLTRQNIEGILITLGLAEDISFHSANKGIIDDIQLQQQIDDEKIFKQNLSAGEDNTGGISALRKLRQVEQNTKLNSSISRPLDRLEVRVDAQEEEEGTVVLYLLCLHTI